MSKKQNQEATIETSTVVEPTETQKICSDPKLNVSQKIRALSATGMKMGPIVKALTESGYVTKNGTPIRFQHVRNVLHTQPKKVG